MGRRNGRPTLFVKKVKDKIIRAVSQGNYRAIAAQSAGVDPSTFFRWLTKGRREKKGEFREFFLAIMAAENEAERHAVQQIKLAGKKDVRHLQWWLERKCPERWGRDTYQIKQLQAEFRKIQAEHKVLIDAAQRSQAVQEEAGSAVGGDTGPTAAQREDEKARPKHD